MDRTQSLNRRSNMFILEYKSIFRVSYLFLHHLGEPIATIVIYLTRKTLIPVVDTSRYFSSRSSKTSPIRCTIMAVNTLQKHHRLVACT